MIDPEFPRHDHLSFSRDSRGYGHNMPNADFFLSQTPELTREALEIEKERKIEHSFMKKFLLIATKTLSRSSKSESEKELTKKRA